MDAHDLLSMQKGVTPAESLTEKCTNGVLRKLKTLTETYSARVDVSLRDKISNPVIQSLDALSTLYQIVTGKFTF
jgi:hypothetical protein